MKWMLIAWVILSSACVAQSSDREFKTFSHNGKEVKYAVQLPDDFDPNKTYPVAIGPSEVKSNGDQSFYWRGIKNTEGWILIDFPIYESVRSSAKVKAFIRHIKSVYKVEGNKFHTICFSANSAGIFDLVMEMPEDFHSITGMAGNPGTRDIAKLSALRSVKVSFVVGDKDTYWMRAAKDRHELLIEAGVDSQLEIIPNGKHVLENLIGKGTLQRMNKLRIP